MDLDHFKEQHPDIAKYLSFRKNNGVGDPWLPSAVFAMPRFPDTSQSIRQWCIDNLKFTWSGLRDKDEYFWFFEDPEEAMWFRLMWNADEKNTTES